MTSRPILSLKSRPQFAETTRPAALRWKCKPCGALLDAPAEAADDEAVRCPRCRAKLGRAGDFRQDPPAIERLRARPEAAPPEPSAVPVIKVRRMRLSPALPAQSQRDSDPGQ